ncbi:MAG: hypothetical protein WDZ56_01675 [Candidatus Paceibacterota bacterium]
MRFQLGIQILLLTIAIAIAFGVIKPKFEEIGVVQGETASYRDAIENMGRYNQLLQTLLNQYNNLPASDRTDLLRYLPESVDVAGVSRDITNIVEQNNLLLLNISFDPLTPVTADVVGGVVVDPYLADSMNVDPTFEIVNKGLGNLHYQRFEVTVVGNYAQMKQMLKDFERNNYPLRLVEFSFSVEETTSSLVEYSLTLETYALPAS